MEEIKKDKNTNQNKKNQIILSILGILSLVLITAGITYAVFTYTKLGSTENTITTGTLKFLYTENTGVGAGINLTNAFPVSDEVGKAYSTENYVFDFSVESTNTGNEAISYEVTLRQKSDSTLPSDIVKVYLTDITEGTDTEILAPALYSSLTKTSIDVGDEIEKTLYQGTVAAGKTDYSKSFRLRMWIDESADFSAIEEDEDGNLIYPYNGKTFTATVNVYANAKVVTEDGSGDITDDGTTTESNTNISSVKAGDTALTKVEDQDYQYETTLTAGTTSTTIAVETVDSTATVTIEKIDSLAYVEGSIKRMAASQSFDLAEGDNYFKVTVTSGTESEEYKLKITVPSSTFVLKDKILSETLVTSAPTLTTTSTAAGDTSGLYSSTDTNTGNPTYYFRGSIENNYVSFAGQTWRIVRVNEDGTIRMVMKTGIGSLYTFNSTYNNYSYMYYSNSEAKTTLDSWYTSNLSSYSDKIATGSYFCEQAKVSSSEYYTTAGSVTMTYYLDYTPNFKCSTDANGKGTVNSNIGLLTYDEVVYAGLHYNNADSNNYLWYTVSWTMSPSEGSDNAMVWIVSNTLNSSATVGETHLRPVINLNADVTAKGSGTYDDPYVIE